MKKGFTLIELLAVIVILSIIALIATPIILEVINNTKEESDKRSVEMYADAIKNSVAQAQLNSNENISGSFTPSNNGKTLTKGQITLKVEYDGNVVCNIIEIKKDGTIYLSNCKVNGQDVEYSYGNSTLAQYISNLYNNSTTKTNSLEIDGITYKLDTTNNLMNDRLGSSNVGEYDGNIRYYGATPNNYIDIGDRDSSGNVILWRIIGVFETKYATDKLPCNIDSNGDSHYDNCASEKLVKIIRNDSLGNMAWETNGVNNWNIATLNTYLNEGTYYTSLNSDVTSKIETVLWNLGGYLTSEGVYANDWYESERGNLKYNTSRPTEWIGKIGLMYPSDYGYAADLGQCIENTYNYNSTTVCKETDWIYNSTISQWTIIHNSISPTNVFKVNPTGSINSSGANTTNCGVRPVLYLKSNVRIVGEETTESGINYYVIE